MPGWNQSEWFSVLVSVAFKSTVVLGVAWLIALVLRRRSAAVRHLVWTAAAAAILALPVLSLWLPSLPVPASAALFPLKTGLVFQVSGLAAGDVSSGQAAPAGSPGRTSPRVPWRPDLRLAMILVWAAGTAVVWAQMLLAYAAMSRVRGAAPPSRLWDAAGGLAGILGIRHEVPVLETAAGGMPMTFGFRKTVVFLPSDASGWGDERRRMVLLHELAHVRRGDVATHLMARAALGLNWWNPLAWIAWREFLKERERAADDLVLKAGARASEYAGHLLEVARSLQSRRATAWAAVAMARRSQIEGRLLAILDSGVPRKEAGRAAVVAAAFLAVVLVAPSPPSTSFPPGTATACPWDTSPACRSWRRSRR